MRVKVRLHYDKNVAFLRWASLFYEPEFLSVKIKWPRLMRKRRVFVVM